MEIDTSVIAFANYEGGLSGFSTPKASQMCSQSVTIKQEFSFQVSIASLTCSTVKDNLLAVSGHEEVIKLYDLKTKKSIGDLSGTHKGSVQCLAATTQHILSGSVDGDIVIWRTKDCLPLHTLKVKNVSAV